MYRKLLSSRQLTEMWLAYSSSLDNKNISFLSTFEYIDT